MKTRRAPWLDGIEGEDAQVLIESRARVIRVVAGPGTGKTTCLKRRVRRQIEGDGVAVSEIFVGTFTRAIARELNEKLEKRIEVSTLHSLAFELLRRYPAARQGMSLRFLLEFEEEALLYDLKKAVPSMPSIHDRKRELRLLQASRSERSEYEDAAFSGAVRNWLLRHRAMLIGDVVYLCVVGLENDDIPPGKYGHVVIDEYQDLTAAEQELVELIWSRSGSLAVMGDDDQSIYGFRFNHPEGIAAFRERWREDDLRNLGFAANRRCGERILRVANLMMAEAGSQKQALIAKSGRTGRLDCVHWPTLDAEVEGLAEFIRIRADESFLVLVPRRFIGYRLAKAIGLDAKTAFREQVLEHPIAQEAFTALSILASPRDWVAVRAWLGLHGSRPKHAPQRNAEAYGRLPPDVGGHELLRRIAEGEVSTRGPGSSHVRERAKRALDLIRLAMEPADAVAHLFDDAVAAEEEDSEKRGLLAGSLRELRDAAGEILSGATSPDLSRAVDVLRYRIATRAPLRASDGEDPRVRIMTLHSAKGLEADNVVVVGVADQLLPGEKTDMAERDEQRRLLYVAITRAKESLVVSWSRRMRLEDAMKNMVRRDGIVTDAGAKWAVTSRSSLLPRALHGAVAGTALLGTARR